MHPITIYPAPVDNTIHRMNHCPVPPDPYPTPPPLPGTSPADSSPPAKVKWKPWTRE